MAAAGQESWIEAALQGARAAGLRVEALRPADLPEGACLTLMPLAEQRQQQAQVILSLWRLALMASLTWVAAAGVFVGRVERERGRTDREITRLEPSARALQAARSALEEAARTVAVIESAAQDQDKVWSSIAVLATALPDSAFITDLRLDLAGRGGISVVALRSGIVLGAIDRAASGLSPRLEGAVLRETIAGRDWERFAIGFGQTSAR